MRLQYPNQTHLRCQRFRRSSEKFRSMTAVSGTKGSAPDLSRSAVRRPVVVRAARCSFNYAHVHSLNDLSSRASRKAIADKTTALPRGSQSTTVTMEKTPVSSRHRQRTPSYGHAEKLEDSRGSCWAEATHGTTTRTETQCDEWQRPPAPGCRLAKLFALQENTAPRLA